MRDAVAVKIVELPEQLRRSLTWDQGKKMAANLSFSVATDVAVYFADPHAPWQRGTNENTQRAAAPVPAPQPGLRHRHRPAARRHRARAQRTSSRNARLDGTIRDVQRARCNRRLSAGPASHMSSV